MPEPTFEEMIDAMKDHDIPFVLGGGLAAWARGGPRSEHDVDLLIREQDAEEALAAYEEAGMRVECPPEGWLVKAWHPNGTLVDLIYSPAGGPITDDTLAQAPEIEVMALRLRVSSLEDLMTTKLLALNEQEPGFGSVLELARALREQIDWEDVRRRTGSSPFARAFFTLVEGLGVVEPAEAARREKMDGPPEGGPSVPSAV